MYGTTIDLFLENFPCLGSYTQFIILILMNISVVRMTFGEMEEDLYQDDLGYTRGQIGKGGAGRIRKVTVDEKTRVRISKNLQKEVARQNSYASGGATTVKRQVAGTASSVAFTPLQGLEIVNPQAADNSHAKAGNKYFSKLLNFKNVKP
jgi:U4/U6 small nuclear ribonucleoprotein PRP31